MRWSEGRRSTNVIDARGRGMGLPLAGGGIGMAVLALVVYLLGGDPSVVTDNVPRQQAPPAADEPRTGPADQESEFIRVVLGDTEDTWNAIFRERFGREYPQPELVLFTDAIQSACGFAQAAMGPFYCPRDRRVYIDLAFYRELRERFRAPGDFAQAYVIAHEVGHHVQTVTGLSNRVAQAREGAASRAQANALSVRQELQADCYAGLWAHHAQRSRDVVEPGDIEEALGAASAIGDDRLQRASQGRVVPESFTHGSSEQRMTWFKRGYEAGTMEACDTFGG